MPVAGVNADKVGIEPSFGLIDPSFVDNFNHDILNILKNEI